MGSIPQKSAILVTGASGFVGSHFVGFMKEHCIIYALARRSQRDAGVEAHSHIQWIRCDIGKREKLSQVVDDIAAQGGVDFIFHFAGYYDFTNDDSAEYQRTNVDGTRYLLELSEKVSPKRFIFSSSLTVTDFSDPDVIISEKSPLDATIPYARSKIAAEELVRAHSGKVPCTIVRLAAIFSDWCEYGPLYVLLKNWLSGSWKARLMPGRGETALPYLHVYDLNRLFKGIMEQHEDLGQLDVLAASPNGCVAQKDLFSIGSRYYYGHSLSLQPIPIWFAYLGVKALEIAGKITGDAPFEQTWMLKYLDRRMNINASFTHGLLGWEPTPRYHITRRMLFLIENMKSNPSLWEERNLAMANKVSEERPGLKIYEVMTEVKAAVVDEHVLFLLDPANSRRFPHYTGLDRETLTLRANLIYEMLEVVFLNGDRRHILCYANYLARQRSLEGVALLELSQVLEHTVDTLKKTLLGRSDLVRYHQRIHDKIDLTLQLLLDEIEDVYDHLAEWSGNELAQTAREHCLRP